MGQRYWNDDRTRGHISRSVNEAQWGWCALQVGVIVILRVWLKKIEATTDITIGALFFSGTPLLRTQLSMLAQ